MGGGGTLLILLELEEEGASIDLEDAIDFFLRSSRSLDFSFSSFRLGDSALDGGGGAADGGGAAEAGGGEDGGAMGRWAGAPFSPCDCDCDRAAPSRAGAAPARAPPRPPGLSGVAESFMGGDSFARLLLERRGAAIITSSSSDFSSSLSLSS